MTVYFDTELTEAMFGDIRRIGKAERETKDYSHMPIPYTSDHFKNWHWMDRDSLLRDNWSIGVMILEILVGTKIIVNSRTYVDFRCLYLAIKDFIHEKTQHLLNYLLFLGPEVKIQAYCNHVLLPGFNIWPKDVRRVKLAISDDASLNIMTKNAEEHWQ